MDNLDELFKNIAQINYTFMLNKGNTFEHAYEFDKFLMDFAKSRGLKAERIQALEGSQSGRVIYITKIQQPLDIERDKKMAGRPPTVKGIVKKLSDRKLRKPAQEFMDRRLRK